jgi:hypothetical protein
VKILALVLNASLGKFTHMCCFWREIFVVMRVTSSLPNRYGTESVSDFMANIHSHIQARVIVFEVKDHKICQLYICNFKIFIVSRIIKLLSY